jgi:tRNA A58 N-methylase Trm61
MKKVFYSFAIAAVTTLMASCGNVTNNGENADSVNVADEVATEEVEVADEPEATKSEDRNFYTVDVPAGWEAKQYVSEMIVKNGDMELNFKEGAQSDVAKWIENIAPAAEAELDAINIDGRTWQVYQNVQGFKTLYLAQVGEGVVRIGSNVEDAQNADVIGVITGVKAK